MKKRVLLSTPSVQAISATPMKVLVGTVSSLPVRLPKKDNLPSLTGLRFWAALLIVAFHTMAPFKLDQRHVTANFGFPQGVTLFFVLSGFILTYNYAALRSWREAGHFIFLRLARIWPTHAFCIVLAFAFDMGVPQSPFTAPATWANVSLLHALIPLKKYFFALNFPSWSVSTEFVFYLCFPFLLGASRRIRFAPILIASVFLILGLSMAHSCYSTLEPEGVWFGLVYVNPLTRMLEFALGIVAAQAFLRNQKFHSNTTCSLSSFAFEFGCVAAAMFSIFVLPTCVAMLQLPSRFGALNFYLSESGGAVLFAALIYALAVGKGVVSRFLSTTWMVWLGEISFAIYMTHIFVLVIFEKSGLLNRGLPRVGLFLEYLVAVIAFAALVNYLVERPVREYAKRLANPLRKSS